MHDIIGLTFRIFAICSYVYKDTKKTYVDACGKPNTLQTLRFSRKISVDIFFTIEFKVTCREIG